MLILFWCFAVVLLCHHLGKGYTHQWIYFISVYIILLLQVSFIGEDGYDNGGLFREFFNLLSKEIIAKYMEPTGTFRHNAVALQVCELHFYRRKLMFHFSSSKMCMSGWDNWRVWHLFKGQLASTCLLHLCITTFVVWKLVRLSSVRMRLPILQLSWYCQK